MSIRTRIVAVLLVALTAAAPAVAQPDADPTTELYKLFREYDNWRMREFPEEAMARGNYRSADRITDMSLEAIERRDRERRALLLLLQDIDLTKVAESDRVSAELLQMLLRNATVDHQFRTHLAPIGTRFGPHLMIPQMGDTARFETLRDFRQYLKRLEQVPKLIADTIERMRLGLEEGRVPPRVAMAGVAEQVRALVTPNGLDRLADPFVRAPAIIDRAELQRLRDRFDDAVLPGVRAALEELAVFLEETYVPGCRVSIAAIEWPNGEAYYAHQLEVMTTSAMTAREIHGLGLREVARIRSEMIDVVKRSDFLKRWSQAVELDDDELLAAFIDYLRTSPRFYYTDAEDLLDGYRAICKTVDGHLPRFFNTLPRLPYGVEPIPDFMAQRQTTAYYRPGDLRNAQAGTFFANTYALDQRPTYEMKALSLHEAVPGHHLQMALAKELDDLPEFRRQVYITAFGEGWALYAERLGIEMGLYEDPYDDFGRLLYEMWRACRLVVDTGMHALGWSREDAIEFMRTNTALSELNIGNEVDRYIAWPGQACGYKIGELRIRELRSTAETMLGDKFDLREFHDVVLGAGAVPLPVMDRRVRDWIGRKRMAGEIYD